MNKKLTAALAASPLIALLAFAPQVNAEEVDEIIVSATGIPTPAAQIGASVDVITAEDLERQQITYLQDALKLKGINIPQNGGPGTLSNVFLRGLPGRYTDLVVDGISMFDPTGFGPGQVLWSDVIADGVSQIEILRGAQGVLYGSNTIAGVISQFTDIGGETSQRTRVEVGEYGTSRFSLTGKGGESETQYGYGISRFETDGFSAITTPSSPGVALEDDAYQNTTMNFKIRQQISESLSVEAVLRHADGYLETDGFSSDEANKYEYFDRTVGRLVMQLDRGKWSHQFGLTNYDSDITRYTASNLSGTVDGERLTADYKSVFMANERTTLIIGADSDQADDGSNEIDVIGAYALIQSAISDALIVTLATRQDDHDLFGTHSTYRATAAFALSDAITLRAAHGTGFRAPSLSELYALSIFCPNGVCGNPNLQPETSVSSELGFDANLSAGLSFGITAYMAEIEDIIGYDSNFVNQQVSGTTEVSGLEAALSIAVSDAFMVNFDAAYTDSDKPNADGSGETQREVRVPRVQAGVSFDFEASERLNLGLGARHVKGVVDVGNVELDDYTLLDLRAAYQINENLKANARLENADDEDYETISGYGTPGRAFYVGVTSSF